MTTKKQILMVKCPHCAENAAPVRDDNIKKHSFRIHNQVIDEKQFRKLLAVCPECNVLVRKDNLQKHMRKAHQQLISNADSKVAPLTNDQLKRIESIMIAAKRRKFSFLLMGRTGVGKSSTINALLGQKIAPIGEFEPQTMEVSHYETKIQEVPCVVIDTPGLCDDLEEKGNDQIYLDKIKSEVNSLDVLWFVTQLNDTRVRPDEKRGIRLISEALGKHIWKRAVIVFTFADMIQQRDYHRVMTERTRLIRAEIAIHGGISVAKNVPAVAISNRYHFTPDGNMWMGELYTKVFTRMEGESALPFLIATAHRVVTIEQVTQKEKEEKVNAMVVEAKKVLKEVKEATKKLMKAPEPTIITPPPQQIVIENHPPPIIINQKQEDEIHDYVKKALPEVIVEAASRGMDAISSVVGGVTGLIGKAASSAVKFVGKLFGKKKR